MRLNAVLFSHRMIVMDNLGRRVLDGSSSKLAFSSSGFILFLSLDAIYFLLAARVSHDDVHRCQALCFINFPIHHRGLIKILFNLGLHNERADNFLQLGRLNCSGSVLFTY